MRAPEADALERALLAMFTRGSARAWTSSVSHPRWSQAKERRITGKTGFRALFAPKVETKMFNGYAEEVAQMYAGLDLKKNY